jgi:two-component system nitrate/nitrite response regulator NarL
MSYRVATVIVHRSALFRAGLEQLLRNSCYRVVASCERIDHVGAIRVTKGKPLLIILDDEEACAGQAEGIKALRDRIGDARVVLLGNGHSALRIAELLTNGIDGWILATISFQELIKSLDLIMLGGSVISSGIREIGGDILPAADDHLAPTPPSERGAANPSEEPKRAEQELTKKESQILRCLMQGESNRSIALRYCLTESTVKSHLKAVLRKIGAANRTQAAIWARANGIFDSEATEGQD